MSRTGLLAGFLVLLVAFGAAPAQTGLAAIDVRLDVPVIAQRFGSPDEYSVGGKQYRDSGVYDCAAASLAMVLGALKQAGRIDASTAVDFPAVRKWLRQQQPNPAKGIHLSTVADGASALTGAKVTASLKQSVGDTWKTTLGDSLSAGIPVIVQVAGPNGLGIAYGSGDHAIVITGLTDSEVFYNDPWEGTAGSMAADEFGEYWGRERTRYWALVFSAGAPAQVSASPSPTSPPEKTVRDIDWKNREYDFDGERIAVVDGRLELPPKSGMPVSYSIQEAATGDLTGDGLDEIVIAQTWSPGSMHAFQAAQVFTVKAGTPVLLLDLPTGSRAFGGGITSRIEGRRLHVSRYEGQAACCPTHQVTQVYFWDGTALVEDASAMTRLPLASPSPAVSDVEKVNAAAAAIIGGPLIPAPMTAEGCRKANPPAGKGCVEQVSG